MRRERPRIPTAITDSERITTPRQNPAEAGGDGVTHGPATQILRDNTCLSIHAIDLRSRYLVGHASSVNPYRGPGNRFPWLPRPTGIRSPWHVMRPRLRGAHRAALARGKPPTRRSPGRGPFRDRRMGMAPRHANCRVLAQMQARNSGNPGCQSSRRGEVSDLGTFRPLSRLPMWHGRSHRVAASRASERRSKGLGGRRTDNLGNWRRCYRVPINETGPVMLNKLATDDRWSRLCTNPAGRQRVRPWRIASPTTGRRFSQILESNPFRTRDVVTTGEAWGVPGSTATGNTG